MTLAFTRPPGPALARCELTHIVREPIDVDRARDQHDAYEQCLVDLGCEVRHLPPQPDLPDAVFVEDTAIVLDELVVITRPGAESRRAETESVAAALEPHRRLAAIEGPGTVDGGDVLVVSRRVYAGLSQRTNLAGFWQLRELLRPLGYVVESVPVGACLHLKSAVTQVGPDALLLNHDWVDATAFGSAAVIDVDPAEPSAANVLLLNGTVIAPAAHTRTRQRLEDAGLRVVAVDVSEIAKAEGGVTCCSLLLEQA